MNKEKQVGIKKLPNFAQLLIKVRRLEEQNRALKAKLASQSAKPGQSDIAASPCPADTLSLNHNTPNSRHPGAKDVEVRKHKLSEKV